MNIFYHYGDKLYVNITNRCSCDCVFCIRKNGDAVGDSDSLWLKREPTIAEITQAFDGRDLSGVTEIVFCGYGEPMERADDVIQTAEYIKSKCNLPLRLNTNGLVKLVNPEFDMEKLKVFDSVSVSLNSDNAKDYHRLTRSVFGEAAFDAMLDFARQAKTKTKVCFSVVDYEIDEQKCQKVADSMSVELRVRAYEGK